MSYTKTISYSDLLEYYEYEKSITNNGRGGRTYQGTVRSEHLAQNGTDTICTREPEQTKRTDNAHRTAMVFRRLVSANLGQFDKPLLISLTYAENITDIRRGHEDFNNFARNVRGTYGKHIRYIAVPEFQKRGAVHFHALFWGLNTQELARSERQTRVFARLWGHGYVDLVATDGDHKIAGYLSKYMAKAFKDKRLSGKKAFVCSRNIRRPVIQKNPLITPYFYGGLLGIPDLSTAEVLYEKTFVSQWLGKGRYRLFKIKQI